MPYPTDIELAVWRTDNPVFYVPEWGYKCVELNSKYCLLHADSDLGYGLNYVGTYPDISSAIEAMVLEIEGVESDTK